ncbi:hypothetical protein [Caldilinea sp.]|nr:hypothetical protein [Caldilinea sp.]HRA65672.1 hypothetical protein [Caldilinea sp.]
MQDEVYMIQQQMEFYCSARGLGLTPMDKLPEIEIANLTRPAGAA